MSIAIDAAVPRLRRKSLFYSGMTVAFLVVVFAGFARTYFLRPHFHSSPLPLLLHVHGFVFTSWVVLLFAQTSLVAAGRTDLHRRLGVAGFVIAALMVVIGTFTGIVRTKPSELAFLTVPLGDMMVFGILAGTGFFLRRNPEAHKRLMMLATITVLPAPMARIPLDFIQKGGLVAAFGLSDLFIAPLLVRDVITRGRPHRATLLGGALLVISHLVRTPIGKTHAWLEFATWLTR